MYAIRILPASSYSVFKVANVSSCHCLQYGHWKSLTIRSQSVADSEPVTRPWSAASRSESAPAALALGAAIAAGAAAAAAAWEERALASPDCELQARQVRPVQRSATRVMRDIVGLWRMRLQGGPASREHGDTVPSSA